MKSIQSELPGAGIESMPLFSGTPMIVDAPAPTAKPKPRRQPSLFGCSICHGIGKIKSGAKRLYCSCQAGETARLRDRTDAKT